MKFLNIGGATGILEHRGKRMMFDPWMDDGIFHGAWYHYPPSQVKIEDVGKLDYLYISHIHEDHCSAGTIRHLNPDLEVILMDMEPHFVLNFLKMNGFKFKKIHQIKPQTPTQIAPDLTVDMITADPAHDLSYRIDSGLVLNWDGFIIYNSNDCSPYEGGMEYIKKTYKHIDFALLPYAGGSGYPACYTNLSADEMRADNKRIYNAAIEGFVSAVKRLGPSYAMPFADQYVIAGSRSHLNEFLSHPPDGGAAFRALKDTGLQGRSLLLNSGQTYDFDAKKKIPDEPFKFHTDEDKETYVETDLKDKLYDFEKIEMSNSVSVERLISYARARLWGMQEKENYFPEFSYYLEMPECKRRFHLPMNKKEFQEISWDEPLCEPRLKISASRTLMILMLIGHISWNIADAAMFLDYERIPNRYDPKIHAFVNFLRI